MTKEQANQNKPSSGSRLREVLKSLLDRLKEEADNFGHALSPQPKPAYQPIPVPTQRRLRR